MRLRPVRATLAVLATLGMLSSAALSTGHDSRPAPATVASAHGQVSLKTSGIFGWD